MSGDSHLFVVKEIESGGKWEGNPIPDAAAEGNVGIENPAVAREEENKKPASDTAGAISPSSLSAVSSPLRSPGDSFESLGKRGGEVYLIRHS